VRADELLDEIAKELEKAKPVPLTNQVRIERDRLHELLRQLREALAAERG
jgi:hypothetical protein